MPGHTFPAMGFPVWSLMKTSAGMGKMRWIGARGGQPKIENHKYNLQDTCLVQSHHRTADNLPWVGNWGYQDPKSSHIVDPAMTQTYNLE